MAAVENKLIILGGNTEMKKANKWRLGVVALASVMVLGACGGGGNSTDSSGGTDKGTDSSAAGGKKYSVALVTDTGGVDDKSFNQSAWEGMQAWGNENGIKKGVGGYNYFQSQNASDYANHINTAVNNGFQTIFGIGYLLKPDIQKAATQFPDTTFGIIDDEIPDMDNVVSATFADHEASYLAGIAAAYMTKTNTVGFIGGAEGPVIDRFEAGFNKGVNDTAEKLGKKVEVKNQYAGDFSAPDKGKSIAASMYNGGADIIFHASGGTGVGVFAEAIAKNEQKTEAELKDEQVWVIGVDRDQEADGAFTTKDGKEANCTLTSTLKGVGAAVQDISNRAMNGEFPGGEHLTYALKDGGVDLTAGVISEDAQKAVDEAKQGIIDGDIEVPEKP